MALLPLVAGCAQPAIGGSPPPAQSAASTPSPSPTPTPLNAFPGIPGVTCPDLPSLGLERALLRPVDLNRPDVVLCDARDLAHPRRVAALEGSRSDSFLTGGLIGYVAITGGSASSTPDQFTSILRTVDLTTGRVTDAASAQGTLWGAAWSSDRSMVAYVIDTGDSHHFWLKRGEAPAVTLGPSIPLFGRGGSLDDQFLVSFSPDGQYVLFVDTAVYHLQVFRTSDGVAVYTAPSGGAGGFRTMATWAHQGDTFYFRNNTGVYRWDPSNGIASFAAGLRWFDPAFSSSDRFLAYHVTSADGTPHVEVRDLSGGATVSSSPWRSRPVFLSSTLLLLEEDKACPAEGICPGYVRADTSAVFHLDTHAEAELALDGWTLDAFWPHA